MSTPWTHATTTIVDIAEIETHAPSDRWAALMAIVDHARPRAAPHAPFESYAQPCSRSEFRLRIIFYREPAKHAEACSQSEEGEGR